MKMQWFQYGPDTDHSLDTQTDNVSDTATTVATNSGASSQTTVTADPSSGSADSNSGSGNASAQGNSQPSGASASDDNNASGSNGDGSTDFLFVDVSPWEANPNWQLLINTSHFFGGILKASQGIKGYLNDGGWFNTNWPQVKNSAADRYGSTWFRGAYVFLNLWQDGSSQADYYLEVVNDAGGWDSGDIIPIVDVELGNDGSNGKPRNRNQDVSSQQIIDCTTACADRLKQVTGRNVMLYGRGAMRDKSINDKMGCDVVWNPCYTATIVMHGLEAWTLDDVVLWQYAGDGQGALPDQTRFPRTIPGFGNTDISVYIEGSNTPSLANMIQRLGIEAVTA